VSTFVGSARVVVACFAIADHPFSACVVPVLLCSS
jgi:hypothetical protein